MTLPSQSAGRTPGPWAILKGFICTARADGSVGMNSKVVAHISNGELREADALRIVACVNACEGISDEMLADRTAFSAPDSYLRGIEDKNSKLKGQLEEAVGAAKSAYGILADPRYLWEGRHTAEGQAVLVALRGAIATATGLSEEEVQNEYGNVKLKEAGS